MASLTGEQLKDTYDSLLKVDDNGSLGGTYKEITDGLGNGSNLYLGTGGNVGIGGSPSVPLEIIGSASTMLSLNRNSGGSDVSLVFKTNTANPDGTFLNGGGSLGLFRFFTESTERLRIHNGGDISFRDGSANEAFYWDASAGSLGIGTTSPVSKLNILQSGDTFESGFSVTRVGANRGTIYLNPSNDTLNISRGGTEAIAIDSSGNVGIGTDSPRVTANVIGLTIGSSTIGGSELVLRENTGNDWRIFNNGYLAFIDDNTERMRIDNSGNLLIGTTATPTSSVGNIVLKNGTAPTGNATDGIILYAEDVSTSSELKVRDEAGNVTTLSPHNFSLIPDGASEEMAWAYYSERDGKKINVDMLKLARMVESLTGEKLVYEQ